MSLLSYFEKCNQANEYRLFVEHGVDDETADFYDQSKTTSVFGTKKFTEVFLKKYFKNKEINEEIAERKMIAEVYAPSILNVIQITAEHYGMTIAELKRSRRGKLNQPRLVAIYCQETYLAIGKTFGSIGYGGISSILKLLHDQT